MSVSIMEELLMVLQTSISNHIHTIKDFHVLLKVVMVAPLQMDMVYPHKVDMVGHLQVDHNSHHNMPSSLSIQMVPSLCVQMATQTHPK